MKREINQNLKPLILDLSKKIDESKFEELKKISNINIIDDIEEQLKELFVINNPELSLQSNLNNVFFNYFKELNKKINVHHLGRWVYFPWLNCIVHILEEKDFFIVRTARNQNLINKDEQLKFYNSTIAVAGLSIGSSVALSLILQGGSNKIKLADFDRLALSNTNRIRAGIQNLGLLKTEMTARQIYEINPYAKIELFSEGLNKNNLKSFVKNTDIIIDEMDSLNLKLLLRIEAKKNKIPVIMGADNADMAVVDIERYDRNKNTKFFHGRMKITDPKVLGDLTKKEIGKNIAQLIGLENHTERMLDSLLQMGKTIVSWPQLGGTAMLNGAAVAYCARKIICGASIEGRAILSLEQIFDKNYFNQKEKSKRNQTIQKFKKILNI